MSGFLFGAFGIYVWFVCVVFLVSGVEMLFGLVPFKTRPLFGLLFVVLSFFLWLVGCLSTTFFFFFSLSLSLSGAGEPQAHAGFVFPLVFLRPGHGLRLRPVPLHFFLHQGFAPHLFLFFSSLFARVFLFGFAFLSCWVVCVCVEWVVLLHSSLASCNTCCQRGGAARDMPPPLYHHCHLLGCFCGMGVRGCPGVPRLNPLHPPLRLPGRIPEIQGLGGRRGRGAFRRQLYCHTCVARSPLVGGNAVRFFHFVFFCVWFGVSCRFFAVLLFLGSLSEKTFGSELLFLVVGVVLVFFGGFLPMFSLYVLAVCSRTCLEKFSCCQVLFFEGLFSLLWVFFVDAVFAQET